MSAAQPFRPALAVSLLLHGLVFAVAVGWGARHAVRPSPRLDEAGATWLGEIYDVEQAVPEERRPPATPAPAPAAPPHPAPPAPVPAVRPATPARVAAPAAKAAPTGEADTPPAPSGSSTSGSSGAAPAAAGAVGADTGTPSLGKAFTKAVTAATQRDPLWDELPLGSVGSILVVLETDAEGRITSATVRDEQHAPAPLRRLVERTVLLLRAGRFALSRGEVGAGQETLRIDVTLSTGEPAEDYDDPRHTVNLGFDAPALGKPGRAYFTHASGRRFEAKVRLASD